MGQAVRHARRAGVHNGEAPMANDDGIDEKNGMVDVYRLLPLKGDSVMIVNCGSHFEIRHHHWETPDVPPVYLTDEDIEDLKTGQIVWN